MSASHPDACVPHSILRISSIIPMYIYVIMIFLLRHSTLYLLLSISSKLIFSTYTYHCEFTATSRGRPCREDRRWRHLPVGRRCPPLGAAQAAGGGTSDDHGGDAFPDEGVPQ